MRIFPTSTLFAGNPTTPAQRVASEQEADADRLLAAFAHNDHITREREGEKQTKTPPPVAAALKTTVGVTNYIPGDKVNLSEAVERANIKLRSMSSKKSRKAAEAFTDKFSRYTTTEIKNRSTLWRTRTQLVPAKRNNPHNLSDYVTPVKKD